VIVEVLISVGGDVNQVTNNGVGRTPLHITSEMGHVEVVEVLISAGEDVNQVDKFDGNTPLHIACFNRRFVVV